MLLAKTMEQHLACLRRANAEISEPLVDETRSLALGVRELDATLGGGLACAALHDLSAAPVHLGAAAGFALALAARAPEKSRQTLWISTDFGMLETGALYGLGIDLIGLDTERLLVARVARPVDALFAMEEALKCRALATVIAEINGEIDLTATRRLSLAAREGGALGLLLRHTPSCSPSAARTRWEVAGAPSVPDEFGGLGCTAFRLSLVRNRRGPCGTWTLTWNHHARVFSALSVDVAAEAADRPDRAALSA
jgi:protein ImuA